MGDRNGTGADANGADAATPPPEQDSEGVYYLSVEDFEWRPKPSAAKETNG